jgi:4-amino-4-deoxy-L-arabinose transferase-like glycosyltransferase
MGKFFKIKIETLILSIILILSGILNFANLGIEGYANTYYSAGVKSMLLNFKNFFFLSSDPSGFVSIDKPPVGFWFQAVSAKIFGFSGWSVILPEALAGVISVGLIYYIVKRSFGPISGLISALCLAVTPIFVASSRNNTIDNVLVLFMLLACLALSIAAEKGNFKFLILSLVFLGIGFNVKMVEAYMVAPALYITYLISSSLNIKKKMLQLILGSFILLAVSLSWAFVVDNVPASNRPFVGSSTNNSVLELIIGHNGLERVGLSGKFGAQKKSNNNLNRIKPNKKLSSSTQFKRSANSQSSITRLFHYNNLSDQISWFLPLAILGFIVAIIEEYFKKSPDLREKLSLSLWFIWMLTEFIYFSFSKNVIHTYYLTTMAPSISALVGIGIMSMWRFYKKGGWFKFLLPISLIINGLIEMLILSTNYNKSAGYKVTLIATGIFCIGASLTLMLFTIKRNRTIAILTSIAFTGILIAPTIWSSTTIFYKMNGSSPSAGLEIVTKKKSQSYIPTLGSDKKLIQFLQKNRNGGKYLVAVPSATSYASDLILKTGEPIMTLGGYSGSDKIINLDTFKKLVSNGDIRYALVNKNDKMHGSNSNSKITNWIKTTGKLVPNRKWQTISHKNVKNETNSYALYDITPIHLN